MTPTPNNRENPHFVASRALIKNRLDESSNLAHRGMLAKFQLLWAVRLVRAMGVVQIESSSYNWRKPVVDQTCFSFRLIIHLPDQLSSIMILFDYLQICRKHL